ncbi:MAG TPA: L,D-transpeptidase [Jatrophihabitantaceae bacterium]|nr:L,D-transpeptidase [Jatrophihabitantaceae bacterium]
MSLLEGDGGPQYRPRHYWPAHPAIRMDAPVKGLSAGGGLVYDGSLTLSISTGAANIATVDGRTERMIVTSDGRQVFDFPLSLGAADHPTYRGTKIVMEKDRVEEMKSTPGAPTSTSPLPSGTSTSPALATSSAIATPEDR